MKSEKNYCKSCKFYIARPSTQDGICVLHKIEEVAKDNVCTKFEKRVIKERDSFTKVAMKKMREK